VKITYADNSKTEFTYDGLSRRVRITERNASNTITSDKRYLWSDGNQPAEERDATTNTVTKRFFDQGEQRIGGADAGFYYYAKDHLGSVREITNSSGALAARYDFDLWGKRTKLSGSLETEVGFTGHHHHAKSGLVLTWYRAYDAEAGRWQSPDPIGEAGGFNLYGYVGGNPINDWDPFGLSPCPTDSSENPDRYAGDNIVAPRNILDDIDGGLVSLENFLDRLFAAPVDADGNIVLTGTVGGFGGGGFKSGGKGNFRVKTRGANKLDKKQVDDAAKSVGIDRYKFKEFLHKEKARLNKSPSDNFTYQQLLDLAKKCKGQ
jgi:RHS repeat-associated protein